MDKVSGFLRDEKEEKEKRVTDSEVLQDLTELRSREREVKMCEVKMLQKAMQRFIDIMMTSPHNITPRIKVTSFLEYVMALRENSSVVLMKYSDNC